MCMKQGHLGNTLSRVTMLAAVAKHVLRRLLFAVSQLPDEQPDAWRVAIEFCY